MWMCATCARANVCIRVQHCMRSLCVARRVGVRRYSRRWSLLLWPLNLSISFLPVGHSWCAVAAITVVRGKGRRRRGEEAEEERKRETNGSSREIPFIRNPRFVACKVIMYTHIISLLLLFDLRKYSTLIENCFSFRPKIIKIFSDS